MASSVRDQMQAAATIIKTAERLIELLNNPSASTIRASASHRIASRDGEPYYRWSGDLASRSVAAIREEAVKKQKGLAESAGS